MPKGKAVSSLARDEAMVRVTGPKSTFGGSTATRVEQVDGAEKPFSPIVDAARALGKRRWEGKLPEERSAHGKMMAERKAAKEQKSRG